MDRTYYRSLETPHLLLAAREQGIDPEMAIAIAERLAARYGGRHGEGNFRFRP